MSKELKRLNGFGNFDKFGGYYDADEVDNVLAEKDQEIAELKLKLEDLQNTYKESVEIKVKIWERCKKAESDAAETLALLEERNKQVGELKAKLEDAKATAYAESVDAGMRERRLKRALWLARAERANEIHFMWCQFIYDRKYGIVKFNVKKDWGKNVKQGQTLHTPQEWADVWEEVERKCRAMAERYGEGK